MLKGFPVHSISLDNGSEFSEFRELEKELHTVVYFAEPHKPWQRGTNENTNGILRFFFPKGCDLRAVSQEYVDSIVALINAHPGNALVGDRLLKSSLTKVLHLLDFLPHP